MKIMVKGSSDANAPTKLTRNANQRSTHLLLSPEKSGGTHLTCLQQKHKATKMKLQTQVVDNIDNSMKFICIL